MKRLTALILATAISVGSIAQAKDDRQTSYPKYQPIYCPDTLLVQLAFMLHGSLRALGSAQEGRLLLLAIMNPSLASAASSAVSSARLGFWLPSYEAGEAGDTSVFLSLSGSYLEQESNVAVRLLGAEGTLRTWRTDLDAHFVQDRWVVSVNVPYKVWKGYGAYEEMEGESLAMQVVPQYFVLQQDSEMVDFSVFAVGGVEHNWFDDDPGIDDVTYVSWGAGAQIGKTFGFGDLSLGYTYQPWINIDGDEELNGTDTLDYHSAALMYAFGFGEGFQGSLKAIWKHTEDLPDDYDSDEYLGRVALGYATECWSVQGAYGQTLASDDFDEWSAELSVSFRW
ncbi:MAG: hypothetical protein HN380_21485 [Victivallales bacterium]|jgi:hypothetical protein|nr:hypothetical protein [Victivallales bacterium]